MAGWVERALAAIDRAFERRLRRASGLDQVHAAPAAGAVDDDDDGVIQNVRPGTVVAPQDDDEAEIVNIPR